MKNHVLLENTCRIWCKRKSVFNETNITCNKSTV